MRPIPYSLDVPWSNPAHRLFADLLNPKIDSMILVLKRSQSPDIVPSVFEDFCKAMGAPTYVFRLELAVCRWGLWLGARRLCI